MPRGYTEQERAAIKQRLIEVGEEKFARVGLRKTTISDLAEGAGIGKGSFYQFFQSKEDLFLAIQESIEDQVEERLSGELESARHDPRRMVRSFFEVCVDSLSNHPFLAQLSDPEILPLLVRTVSPERMERMQRQNHSLFRDRFQSWIDEGIVQGIDADTLFALMGAILVLHQHPEALGGSPDSVLSWMIDSICRHVVGG